MSTNVVTPAQAKDILLDCISAGLVTMLHGSPGIGKSDIVHQVAKAYNLKLIDMRLSQCDPTDLSGFPQIQGNKAAYVPMDTFPLKDDPLPLDEKGEEMGGWLLMLDEINQAKQAIQSAAYKLILDRKVGQHSLHKNVAIVCAGNLETDGAITNRVGTALQSRMVHLEIQVDPNGWLGWARSTGIDHRITSFINYMPEKLHMFNPDHQDKTFACPRTWEFASRLLKKVPDFGSDKLNTLMALSGTISEGMAREFASFCEIYRSLPSVDQIVRDPSNTEVPDEPATRFALTGAIGSKADDKNIDQLMVYINRLPKEFQTITLREIMRRDKSLSKKPSVMQWVMDTADFMV